MDTESVVVFTFFGGVVAGVWLLIFAMRQRTLQFEMRHRERMAMIERGQIPLDHSGPLHLASRGGRSMSIGIMMIGLGLALATVITFAAGVGDVGLGIGGAIAILGGAFVARSLLVKGESSTAPAPSRTHDL